MIEYGTFGLTANYQDLQQTLNNGAVLNQNNDVQGLGGPTDFEFNDFTFFTIGTFALSNTCFLNIQNDVINNNIGVSIDSFGIGITPFTRLQSAGGSLQINYITAINEQFGYRQYQTTDIKIGSNIQSTTLGTFILFDNYIPGLEQIKMYIGTGPINYYADEIRYISTTPGNLIQGTKGAALGFLTIRSATQQYKIRLYAP